MDKAKRTAVIIGAGPAGLTAALNLLHVGRILILPIVRGGGAMRLAGSRGRLKYKGNRMDH